MAPAGRAVLQWRTEKDAYVRWPGSSAQEEQVDSFSPAGSTERDYYRGRGGRNREREMRSPDVYSLYEVSKGFGNKIEKTLLFWAMKSDMYARSPHLFRTEIFLM